MATINHPVGMAFTLKTSTFTFKLDGSTDIDDFTAHVGEITFTPTAQTGSWTGISGNVISESGASTWTATLGMVQDLDDDGLLLWLLEHEGEKAEGTAMLKTGTGAFKLTVTLVPAVIGGAPGPNPLSSSVTLPMDGKPVRV